MKLFPVKMRYFWCQNSFTLSETFGADFQPLCLMVKDFSLLLVSWCKKQKKKWRSQPHESGHIMPRSLGNCVLRRQYYFLFNCTTIVLLHN